MIVMVLVAAAVTMLASHYGLRARMVSQEARRIHLVALTDAAVAESLAHLDQSASFGGVAKREFGGGTLSSEIESLPEDRRVIRATASYRGWTRAIQVQVKVEEHSLKVESWSVLPSG
jgi:hypothetical protein